MFGFMTRRLLRHLVHALAIAQVLLSAPVVSAATASTGAGMPCHGEMAPASDHEKECACCPDGVTSTAGCLAQCAGATAANTLFVVPVDAECAERVEVPTVIPNGDSADPPLKPPPIL